MPADMFLEIKTKKGGVLWGESDDADFKDLIQVSKFEVSLQSPADYDKSKTGRVSLQPVKFFFATNYSSKGIFETLCTNDLIESATLTVRRPGSEGAAVFLRWRFNNARISEYKMSGENENTTDELTLVYSGLEIYYSEHTAKGQAYVPLLASYDSNANKMVSPTLK